MNSPVRRISIARQYGICRARRTVDPPAGKSAHRGSGSPKRASSDAIRTSVACSSSVPPATQMPRTAATTGFVIRNFANVPPVGPMISSSSPPEVMSGRSVFRSAPEQNAWSPSPVITPTAASSSASSSCQAATSCCTIS